MIEEALTEARRLAHENRLEGKDLDELDELEDDEDEDFLDSYRFVVCYYLASAVVAHPIPGKNDLQRCLPYKLLQSTTKCTIYRNQITLVKLPRNHRRYL